MKINEMNLAEQKLNRLANLSVYHQSFWLFILALILFFKPQHYRNGIQYLGCTALIASFGFSKIYIQAGKKLEEFKIFSSEEARFRKKEYMFRFWLPYIIWSICLLIN